MSVLSVNRVHYAIGEKKLLDDVSVDVDAGEVLAIVGPNGAGKTTLLKAISGDLVPNEGQILLGGKDLEQWSLEDKAKHLSVLPQFSLLNFPYTVQEVVALGRIPHSTGLAIDTSIVQHAMAMMDIEHLAQSIYTQLSGGEKQRTQLARVMMQVWRKEDADLRILLLDEPSASLDLGHQQQLMQVIKHLTEQGVAVVMIIHDINIAIRYSDRILALLDGKVLAQGRHDVITPTFLQTLFNADVHLIEHPSRSHKVIVS